MRIALVLAIAACSSPPASPRTPVGGEPAVTCEDGHACLALAKRYYTADGIGDRDDAKAFALYEQACKLREPEGCAWAGVLLMNGEGVDRDFDKALPLLRAACSANVVRACVGIRLLEYQGAAGLPADPQGALAKLGALCDAKNGAACGFLAGLWLQDRTLGDETKAQPFARAGCDLGDAQACFWDGVITYNGIGTKADPEAGFRSFARACELNDGSACATYGISLFEGRNIAKDPTAGILKLRRGCALAMYKACSVLGRLLQTEEGGRDGPGSTKAAQRACDHDELGGCAVLATNLRDGFGAAVDVPRAIKLFRRACDEGGGEAEAGGCFELGLMYYKGSGLTQNRKESAKLFEEACERKWAEGCTMLAQQYERGEGVAADAEHSAALRETACKYGDPKACTH